MKKYLVIGAIVFVAIPLSVLLWALNGIYRPVSQEEIAIEIVIEEGAGVQSIARQFEEVGMVKSVLLFRLYTIVSGDAANLQAGTYYFAKNSSIRKIVMQLAQGDDAVLDTKITIIEGWQDRDIRNYLHEQGFAIEGFEEVVEMGTGIELNELLEDGKPENSSLHGYLFPDTYQVYYDSTAAEIVQKMIDNLISKITPQMEAQVAASDMSFYEIVTLASIVEKELLSFEERRIGAGIFLQRLEDGYPLESDATVNYITGKKTTRPTYDDVATESPYNTYDNIGLPPSPICNPGIESIKAVLDPVMTDNYFFLTTTEGEAIFSKTYSEHLNNVAKYYP